jgi:hypothetical protein
MEWLREREGETKVKGERKAEGKIQGLRCGFLNELIPYHCHCHVSLFLYVLNGFFQGPKRCFLKRVGEFNSQVVSSFPGELVISVGPLFFLTLTLLAIKGNMVAEHGSCEQRHQW